MAYYQFGPLSYGGSSDGSAVSNTVDASTNYSAPTAISTQSYGETISYNSWLGVASTTGLNGEQLTMAYDAYGGPGTSVGLRGCVGLHLL